MPRNARVVIPGLPHRITHRTNGGEKVFLNDEDRQTYLRLLRKYAESSDVEIRAYCLMTKHIHLIAIPGDVDSFAEAIGVTHGQYATLFNDRHTSEGHLWHSRFFSCVLDEFHYWNAIRYVELNPVRAGFAARAEDYPWSSAPTHCGHGKSPLFSFPSVTPACPVLDWSNWLAQGNASGVDDQLRQRTLSGIPCGSPDFLIDLELKVGRPLTCRKRGRPCSRQNGDVSLFPPRERK
jgi:putative transposase